MEKACAESENVKWIAANTKKCPGCHKAIEKNQGCNHMTCLQCRHEFCWVCMGDWKEHGTATGGYYKCNVYEKKKSENKAFSEEEKKREDARHELERYTFYFQRYDGHDKAGVYAQKLKPSLDHKIEMLVEIKNYSPAELKFLSEGCAIVIQSRNVLKCSYAYAYYNTIGKNASDKDRFENWQGMLESFCDRLHGEVERNLDEFLDPNEVDRAPFYKFRDKFVTLS